MNRMFPPHERDSASKIRLSLIAIGLLLAGLTSSSAGSLSTTFDADPGGALLGKAKIDSGYLKLQDLQDYIDGTSTLPMHGAYVFPDIDGGEKVAAFTARFQVSIHGGTETPAQGFSFVFGGDIATFSAPFREGGGSSSGLVVSFDTVDNSAGNDAEGNVPGDAPGIIIKLGGQRIAAKKFLGLRTGPQNSQTPVFVPVEIKLEADGTIDVTYNGTKVYDNVGIPFVPMAGSFGVGAGTAEITAAIRCNHWFNDMNLTTTTLGSGPALVGLSPIGTAARPDAPVQVQIEGLGSGSVKVSFDDQVVSHQASTANGVTTVTYQPPVNLAPGSAHNVQVAYGNKTINWGYSVIEATVIPVGAALAASQVDTAKTGFKVRVHQLESTPAGGNTAQRAEDQLAGKLGANVADLSGANADGSFDRETINMEQDGGAAGLFTANEGYPDDPIPGIPGSVGNTDNIAMEATGYLELKKGVYTFGAVSDDSARLTIGADPRDVTAARLIDTAIGTVTSTVLVDQDGIYPCRLLWTEGNGGAGIELWTVDSLGKRILLNDRAASGHIKVYRSLKSGASPAPFLSSAKPAPGDANVATTPRLELAITEENTQVTAGSIKLYINDAPLVLATDAVSKNGKVTTVTHRITAPLAPESVQKVRLEFGESAGRTVVREFTFSTGKATAANLAVSIKGQWDFNQGNLKATVGRDLHFLDDGIANRYRFGTTAEFSIPAIGGQPARVLHIPYTATDEGPVFKKIGLKLNHGIAPNGAGTKVNQWTLIMDVLWGNDGPSGFGSIIQTHDLDNPTDGDMFWRASDGSYGKNCCSLYDGISTETGHSHKRGEWARLVFTVDLAGSPRRLAKYVNGFKHRDDVTGDGNALDSRFALPPEFFLFGDGDDNERTDCYVNSIQLREGAMTDEEVAALGGASAAGIPMAYAQWDFDEGNLSATAGPDLTFLDASIANRYQFGTTTQLGIAGPGGKEARVLHIPYTATDEGPVFKKIGLRAQHGMGANGGGQKLNQYTLIMDVLWGNDGPSGFGSIIQTHDLDNPTDGDMFWRASDGSYGKNCCSLYDGISSGAGHFHKRGEWARVVFAVDLSTSPRRLAKFINGYKHRDDVTGDGNALDSRFALPAEFFLFGDGDDNERTDCYVNSVQMLNRALTDEEIVALGGPTAGGIPSPNPVKGEWNFDDGNLTASTGQDLAFLDAAMVNRYQFGTTTQLGVPGIDGKEARVLHIPYTATDEGPVFKKIGLKLNHGVAANGGGTKVNQWTLIMDVLWGNDGPSGFGSIIQTHDLDNPTDGDMFWRASDGSYGKNCCSLYDGISTQEGHFHKRGEWARLIFAVDLSSTPRRLAKYINGFKHRDDVTGDGNSLDSRFALPPEVLLFGDGDDNERTDCYVNAIQVREGAVTDEEAAALGRPSSYGIPGAASGTGGTVAQITPTITVAPSGAGVVLTWKGTLQSADTVNGAYKDVSNASSPMSVTPSQAQQYYRARR